jgi:hypothetical protein
MVAGCCAREAATAFKVEQMAKNRASTGKDALNGLSRPRRGPVRRGRAGRSLGLPPVGSARFFRIQPAPCGAMLGAPRNTTGLTAAGDSRDHRPTGLPGEDFGCARRGPGGSHRCASYSRINGRPVGTRTPDLYRVNLRAA